MLPILKFKWKKEFILIAPFFFFIFFPYICIPGITKFNTDIQPNALIMAGIIFLFLKEYKFPLPIILLFFSFMASLLLLTASPINYQSFRCIGKYSSLFFISATVYYILKNRIYTLGPRFFRWIALTWFLVGFIQTYINGDFLTFLLNRGTGYAGFMGRGVIGLATEQTFYGNVCIFLILLSFFHNPKDRLTKILLLIQILLFAKSTTVSVYLIFFLIYFFYLYASTNKLKYIASTLIVIIVLYSSGLFHSTRIEYILSKFLSNPYRLLAVDRSMTERILHIYFSTYAFIMDFFMPHGFNNVYEPFVKILDQFKYISQAIPPDFLLKKGVIGLLDNYIPGTQINSGYGTALFQLGFIGLFIPASITISLYRFFNRDGRKFLLFTFFINTILFSAIPLSFPLTAFLVGYLCYRTANIYKS